MEPEISIIIPAKNEADSLRSLLPQLKLNFPQAEIMVINDGSTDETLKVCQDCSISTVSVPYSLGNGAAVKHGARVARGRILVFMDADGQHDPADIHQLFGKLAEGYDMVVGARTKGSHAGLHRATANGFYNRLASWMTGRPIPDLTSGFRAVRADKFRKFLYLLPNGFSYPTTITMSFFRTGYSVAYIPISAKQRIGKSHIRLVRDGVRFLLIIFKIGTLYSPLKLFLPVSVVFFLLGLLNYLYTYITAGRFTNMSALLFVTSVIVFLIGLVSEQVSALNYKDSERS
ncbi:MAG: glycosyltransferase family 2 protein [Acidiferrobacterales bacterium]